jgi:hypothetical protein
LIGLVSEEEVKVAMYVMKKKKAIGPEHFRGCKYWMVERSF